MVLRSCSHRPYIAWNSWAKLMICLIKKPGIATCAMSMRIESCGGVVSDSI